MRPYTFDLSRASFAAFLGTTAQAISALALGGIALTSGQPQSLALTWYTTVGILPWLFLLLLYYQHRQERIEAQEQERVTGDPETGLFADRTGTSLHAHRLLQNLYRFYYPSIGAVYAFGLGISGIYILYTQPDLWGRGYYSLENTNFRSLALAILTALAFLNFVLSRYITGLADTADNKSLAPLAGGASLLIGNTLLSLLLAAGLAFSFAGMHGPLKQLHWVLPLLLLGIALEVLLGLLLDLYRPRRKEEIQRAAYEARLLKLLAAPASIASLVRETIDYQFGFEITRSWFWKLLGRVVLPLLALGIGSLLLLSCLVFVEAHQEVAVFNFGALQRERIHGPGLHFKAPWPLATVQIYDRTRIRTLRIGSHSKEAFNDEFSTRPVLYTNQHASSEELLIVAAPSFEVGELGNMRSARSGPSVSLIGLDVTLHVRIKDLADYLLSSTDPEYYFRLHAERALTQLLMREDLDAWIGESRNVLGPQLKERLLPLAERCGLELLFVGVAGLHPPQEIADAFQSTVQAEQEREIEIQKAEKDSVKVLAEIAGSKTQAQTLIEALDKLQLLVEVGDAMSLDVQRQLVERELLDAGGKASELMAEALAYRWTRVSQEQARALTFGTRLEAYRSAPEVYRARRWLEVLATTLSDARKFLLLGDRDKLEIRMDLKELDMDLQGVNLLDDGRAR